MRVSKMPARWLPTMLVALLLLFAAFSTTQAQIPNASAKATNPNSAYQPADTDTPSATPTFSCATTPTPTATVTLTATVTATSTPTVTLTPTLTATPLPTCTATAIVTASATHVATFTPTNTPTDTPVPPTSTPIPPTNTPVHTSTPMPPTNTPMLTNTPIPPTGTPIPPTATPAPSASPTQCPLPFVDLSGNVFRTAIQYLYCQGVVSGTDATHYSPAASSTRAQFAKLVVLGFGLPFTTPATPTFSDVPPTNYAFLYIESGYSAHILNGYDQAGCQQYHAAYPCYLPNKAITRAELAKLVVLAANYPLATPIGGGQSFSDVPPSSIFYIFIETGRQRGLIDGYPDDTFRPNNNIRRDEMSQIVFKGVTTP